MKRKFIVERREVWIQAVAIMAKDSNEAKMLVDDDGQGNTIEAFGYFVYSDTLPESNSRAADQGDIDAIGEMAWDDGN